MDILTIAAVLSLIDGMIPGFTTATQAAQDAADAANEAAADAAGYAEAFAKLETAVNMLISQYQQEIRDLRNQVDTLNAQLAALAGS